MGYALAWGNHLMDISSSNATPMVAAIIVLIAIVALGGISFAFQGSVQF